MCDGSARLLFARRESPVPDRSTHRHMLQDIDQIFPHEHWSIRRSGRISHLIATLASKMAWLRGPHMENARLLPR